MNERNKELSVTNVIATCANRRLRIEYRKDGLKEIPSVTPRVVRIVLEEYQRAIRIDTTIEEIRR